MFHKISITIIILIILAIIGSVVWLGYFINGIFTEASGVSEEKIFVIEEGQGVKGITRNLEEQGLIKSAWNFRVWAWLRGREGKFIAGEHQLKTDMNIIEIVSLLTSGQAISKEKKITIIEGWRASEMGEYLENQGLVKKKDFLSQITPQSRFATAGQAHYDFLSDKPDKANLEGYLFPDTYYVYKDAKADDIIKKMLDNLDRKLTLEMRLEIKNQGKTIFETITMASIIEKEVAEEQDRRLVADIFYKRLKIGMPLQADSTVNFVTGKKAARALKVDTEIDSSYNTYKYRGLPPGPISNPGLSAIQAAIYPIKNDYWYFLNTEDGRTIFSRTNEEHNINKAKYLK